MSARRALDLSLSLVTDAALCGERGVVATVEAAVAGGATIVQLRDKHAGDEEFLVLLGRLAAVIDGRVPLIVNDRLELALRARADGIRVDGVHLGQGDASVLRARAELGPDAIVGLTANTPAHLDAVAALPAGTVDYLGVGVLRPTSTKPDHPPALGLAGFAGLQAAARDASGAPVPCVAIGGVRMEDAAPLRAVGAAGVAIVSAICAAPDPRRAAAEFAAAWRDGVGPHPAHEPHDGRRPRVPRVLSIAGSDPSGGAGIQADLKSIAAVGGYDMAAITALTAQNTRGVRSVHVPPAASLREQLDAISDDITVDAVKLGMLADADLIRTVAEWLGRVRPPLVVLDPVMVSTSGDRLLDREAEQAMRELLPLADLVTPNLAELAVLAGAEGPAADWASALEQATALSARTGALVLAKGGHLGGAEAPDALVDARAGAALAEIVEFHGERIDTTATHGTGCSLSSAIATLRARHGEWAAAVAEARRWLRESLRHGESLEVGGGHGPVHHFAGLWSRGGLATRPTAAELEEEWWAGLSGVREAIDELPFIRGLADGSLPRAAFDEYLAQDAHYLREYARALAEAARLAPDASAQAFWAAGSRDCLTGELARHERDLGGARADDARSVGAAGPAPFEPNPVNLGYLDHLLASSARGGYPELVAAVLPCYWIYDDLGRRLLAGELGPEPGSPEHPYADWLAMYADPSFAVSTRRAIELVTGVAAAAAPEVRERMRRAFRRSAEFELAFFAAPLAGSPDDVAAPPGCGTRGLSATIGA
ncbi:bifunctional hydroxymethylpyrimidine kinase/phosphomethylpyrimidine kinase [Agromyces mediolanus]|uniref:bifunctional hydroxymethylpyrimidine kinase/phosphomethylpyrimidine kinase n=1 Tax=Agromyces mediolanus TaxID=41986 RepID=UPI002041EA17|nr:bifunctional hydroxymethylpyrimidine kinase/phosphomethylpyrimidine kinase [Agromyces mediolanus]MCM3657946.1 bifunctional hydroxymethylpyrimidine kinase/phosphomethylpyrimidine kinase [Agromyces mediolanus]